MRLTFAIWSVFMADHRFSSSLQMTLLFLEPSSVSNDYNVQVKETAESRELSFVVESDPNNPSVQSVVPLSVIHGSSPHQWTGLEGYWATILLALAYLDVESLPLEKGLQKCRALVIGLGGGLLPKVLVDSFPGLQAAITLILTHAYPLYCPYRDLV